MAEARDRLLKASCKFTDLHKMDAIARVKALKVVTEIEHWTTRVEFELLYGSVTELEKLEDGFDALQVRVKALLSDVLCTYI